MPPDGTKEMPDSLADSFQISPQQEQRWAAEPDGAAARTQAVLAIKGQVADSALTDALRTAVSRHESLRTTFVRQPGLTFPVQGVHPALDPDIETLDVSTLDPQQRSQRLQELLRSELRAPWDLQRGPLVRAKLVRTSADRADLVLTLSALCVDQSSTALLLGELAGQLAGAELVEDPLQYADFSSWQHELQSSDEDEARAARASWTELAKLSSPELPFSGAGATSDAVQEIELEIDPGLAGTLVPHAGRYAASLSAFAQAAWHAVLGRLGATDSCTVAYLSGDRRHPDLDGAVGAFARAVPIQTDVNGKRSFAEVLAEVDRARGRALVLQDYAPDQAVNAVDIGFADYASHLPQPQDAELTIARMARCGRDLPLVLMCGSDGEQLRLRLVFDPARHRAATVKALGDGLIKLLGAVAGDPGVRLGEVDLLGEEEREHLFGDWAGPTAAVPRERVHELIARWAVSAPDRDAVLDADGTITYAQLDARANQLAQHLRRLGVRERGTVGLCTDRSIAMVVGLLGILKAGAAYVPLHHEHPPARLRHQLASAGASAVVTQEALLDRLAQFDGPLVCLDRDSGAVEREPEQAPEVRVDEEDLAYVIYTSGSTGTPKGVQVTHRNVVNYAAYIAGRLQADRQPLSFGLVTSVSTDLGNTSVFGALCSGGTLVLVRPEAAADPGALAGFLERTPVDVLKITPSHIGALLAANDARVLPRRWLVVGGERAGWDLVERVRALSGCQILNHYGPTETTIGSCTHPIGEGRGEYEPAGVPIGTPIANTRCYVIDHAHQPALVGVAGKLFIAGAGVARGYAGEPQLTAERFLADPFVPRDRMYDTGDVARWLPDGTLEFLGRADEQIKIRGYRVEPAEVEAALRSHPGVREAVAVVQAATDSEPRLLAYCAA